MRFVYLIFYELSLPHGAPGDLDQLSMAGSGNGGNTLPRLLRGCGMHVDRMKNVGTCYRRIGLRLGSLLGADTLEIR